MSIPIDTKRTRDNDGNRALKSDTCPFLCIKYIRDIPVPCKLYVIEAGEEMCRADEASAE